MGNNIIIGIAIGFIAGGFISYYIWDKALKKRKNKMISEAHAEGEVIKKDKILQAKEKFFQLKSEHEKFINEKNSKIAAQENRINQKDTALNQRRDELQRRIKEFEITKKDNDIIRENLNNQLLVVEQKNEELSKLHRQQVEKLEALSGMSGDEAKAQLVESLKEEAKSEA
ncbi:MAG: DUF3552 domain-containing protein, partial [Prolixibacteraceae bacterium]|nr:DUF3552 domain-containing protein [Prolixibacteraceae bacterium]